jgi:SAM-dependent methyltransferase
MSVSARQFFREYACHRAGEGRALRGEELRSLPYLRENPLARQWAVRARSFEALVAKVVNPLAAQRSLHVLDLGAGNGWLCHRLAQLGHRAVAFDIRDDNVDGLGAAAGLSAGSGGRFQCVAGSFDGLPFGDRCFDLAIFNASLHYATDLGLVLAEAVRVTRPGGAVAIVDSPFYASEREGERMIAEKKSYAASRFGAQADVLMSQAFIEFLTRPRLEKALPALLWSHHRVHYPLWYELRPLVAWLRRGRRPSRFDVWSARVP